MKIRSKHNPVTKYARILLRKFNRAVDEFSLIENGDRIAVAVSGGKDSLALLHLLLAHRRFYTLDYDIEAVHVVSDLNPNAGKLRDYLEGMFDDLDIGYTFESIEVTKDEDGNDHEPGCFLCSWKRREALFRHCVRKNANRLAFGHHADDAAETIMLNLVYHGTLETTLPKRSFFDGKFDVIRPCFYLKENELARYARLAGFETTSCACPNEDTSKRRMMKDVLKGLSREARQLHINLWNASKAWHEAFADRPLHTDPARKRKPQET